MRIVNAFGDATREAGAASPEQEGNWAKSTFEDLVQYNDGFKTNLIGTPQNTFIILSHRNNQLTTI